MQKIISYNVLTSNYLDRLEKDVNNYISLGWQPFGGVSPVTTEKLNQPRMMGQAMVLYEDNLANGELPTIHQTDSTQPDTRD